MLEDLAGQRVAERQLAQHVGVRRGPGLRASQDRQLELLEEDLRELLGRGDRELLAGQRVDLAREVVEVALELFGEGLEPGRIHADARPLHLGEHRHQRPLDLLVDVHEPALLQIVARMLPEAREPARAVAEHARQVVRRHIEQRRRTLAERLHADLVELVRRARRVEQVRGHGPRSRGQSGSPRRYASRSKTIGTSRLSTTSSRESRACLRPTASVSRSLPGMSVRLSYRRATEPYWPMSFTAVFSPTPFTPGTLSIESPMSAITSGIWSGPTPQRSRTFASS